MIKYVVWISYWKTNERISKGMRKLVIDIATLILPNKMIHSN